MITIYPIIKHICPVCNKEFEKKVYKEAQAIYCSRKCAYKGRSLGFTIRRVFKEYKLTKKLKPRYQKICLICQKEFLCKKENRKYCSRKCFEISHSIRMKGSGNSAFIDGRSYQKRSYRGNDWETLRIEIYNRDKYICQDCGIKCISKRDVTEETFDRIIGDV